MTSVLINIIPITDEVLPVTDDANEDYEPKMLVEDRNQGEMDMIFWAALIIFLSVQASLRTFYPDIKDYIAIGKFDIIMSNLWAFFPICQSQGLLLKFLLICTCWYSILWHWSCVGFAMPGSSDTYGGLDTMFSALVIQTYAFSWFPKLKTYIPRKKDEQGKCGWWYKSCRGHPKHTSEWRCRWTPNMICNVFFCVLMGVLYIENWPWYIYDVSIEVVICYCSIILAFILAIWHLIRGKMQVGRKYRKNFIFWTVAGIPLGIVAYIYKIKSNNKDIDSNVNHSVWHACIFSCAYCLSRAQEYLEIY
tara:strand:+ start:714 stop:1631 length:918 start_codon:yes stop_codon:yes gene_type:complete